MRGWGVEPLSCKASCDAIASVLESRDNWKTEHPKTLIELWPRDARFH